MIKVIWSFYMLVQPIYLWIRFLSKELLFPHLLLKEALNSRCLINCVLEDIPSWCVNLDLNGLTSYYGVNFCQARRPIHIRLGALVNLFDDGGVV
jgi:hypothetical protein